MRSSVPRSKELRAGGRPPSLPLGLRIYAIGDIHGRLDLLNRLLSQIDEDIAQFPTIRPIYVFLGDYIDGALRHVKPSTGLLNMAPHTSVYF